MRRTIITWFGCGDMPIASGTWGSAGALLAAALWWGACGALSEPAGDKPLFDIGLSVGVLMACALSVRWGPWAMTAFEGHHNTRKNGDPGAFVLDEVAGQWLSLLFLPIGTLSQAMVIVTVQFFAFRVADVLKPPPGRRLEQLPGGWGILMDDISSAIYVNLMGQVLFRVCLGWT